MALASVIEESGQVFRNRCWFLGRGEVPAAWKDGPPPDVVHALQIRARWFTLGNGLVREDAKRGGCTNVSAIDGVPAIVPIVAH